MKDVMISIRPKWCELEANGEKTIEVRKTRPKIDTPFKCRIYCSKNKDKKRYLDEFDIPINTRKWLGNGKVIGEFVCDKIEVLDYLTQIPNLNLQNGRLGLAGYINVDPFYNGKVATLQSTLLNSQELIDYGKGKPLYAWHISDLKIYDEPKELSKFGISRPPQSWQYCEELEENNNE